MRNVLTVFIASPSDLAAERKRTFEVVAEVSDTVRTLDWSVELLGWEDTLPGYGRPQALINKDVDRCDLFIGMLWRRWGTPPTQDSTFSSGFEEEFSIARSRRQQTPSPEIWMFFKTVESEQIADAGMHLQRVIAFRNSLVEAKEIFFKEFSNIDDWEKMLRTYLYKHVLSLTKPQSAAPEGPSEGVTPHTSTISTEADVSGGRAAGRQIAELAHRLSPAFETGDLSEVSAALNDSGELAFLAVRSLLLSAALISASRSSETPLPIHELNTLYRYRDRLRAADDELYVIFRTILADSLDRSPGWYWFRDDDARRATNRVIVIALADDNTAARSKAFAMLREGQVHMFDRISASQLEQGLGGLPSDLHAAAWTYLVDVATPEDVQALGKWAAGTWLQTRVEWLHAWTEAGRDLDHFLPEIPDPQLIPDSMKQLILAKNLSSQLSH